MDNMDKEKILAELKGHLQKLFQIAPETVTPEANLYTDLGLDSIDAVDLVVQLQRATGRKIKPEEFKAVRTVSDVVDAIARLLSETPPEKNSGQ